MAALLFLVDALLLEGHRDPKEIYIALRTNGHSKTTLRSPAP